MEKLKIEIFTQMVPQRATVGAGGEVENVYLLAALNHRICSKLDFCLVGGKNSAKGLKVE